MSGETDRQAPCEGCPSVCPPCRVLIAPCCGRPMVYCECPEFVQMLAGQRAIIARDNDTPRMAADDPRRAESPPF